MAEHYAQKKPTNSRAKVAMIATLSVVLGYLIYAQLDDGPDSSQGAGSAEFHSTNLSAADTNAGSATVAMTWPTTPLVDVLAVNPFKLPGNLKPVSPLPDLTSRNVNPDEELASTAESSLMELQDAIKNQRLKAIIQTTKGVGAIVGDAVVGVGDTVGDRLRVREIRSNEVVFELIKKPVANSPRNE